MKLFYCPKCKSIASLSKEPRFCDCHRSGGVYTDDIHAEIWGAAIPLGIANDSFLQALQERPDKGLGKEFIAFVIPRHCVSIRRDSI